MATKINDKTISTFIVLLVMFFTLVYTTAAMLRAMVYIIAFVWTFLRQMLVGHGKCKILAPLHMFWIISFYLLVVCSKQWHLYPKALGEVQNNVLWSLMISYIIVDYIVEYNLSAEDIAKVLIPISILYIFYTLIAGSFGTGNRLSIENNANTFGKIGAGMVWIFLYQCVKTKWKKGMWIVLMTTVALISLLSGSRKLLVSIAVFFIGYLLFRVPSRNAIKLMFRVAGIIVLVAILYVVVLKVDILYNTIGNRIEALVSLLFYEGEGDASTLSRLNMQSLAIELFSKYPVLGAGINAFKYSTYYGTYSHCNYTEILSGLGIVGFCIYYAPIIMFLWRAVKNWRNKIADSIVPLSYLLVFLVNEYGGVSYFSNVSHLYFAIAIGLMYVDTRKRDIEMIRPMMIRSSQ